MILVLTLIITINYVGVSYLASINYKNKAQNTISKSEKELSGTYYFKVLNETVHVYPKRDGSIFINYTIEFENHGDPIDVIDIGFPNEYYNISTVHAKWCKNNDGEWHPIIDIRPSTYIDIGVEVHIPYFLQIQENEVGTLIIWGNNPHMIYQDTEKQEYAGYEFSPTWFSSDFCSIVQDLYTYLHFPEGFFNKSEAYYHRTAPTNTINDSQSIVFVYHEHNVPAKQFIYGISFPKKYVDTVYYSDFRFILPDLGTIAFLGLLLVPISVIGIYARYIRTSTPTKKRHKKHSFTKTSEESPVKYESPVVKTEAFGVNRGLTAVEVAVLFDIPLKRIFGMIIYTLVKKGVIDIIPGKPLKFKKKGKNEEFEKKIRYYEKAILRAIRNDGTIDKDLLTDAFVILEGTIIDKMKGYSISKTKKYYERKINEILNKPETIEEEAEPTFSESYEWVLVKRHPVKHFKRFNKIYLPLWMRSTFTAQGTSLSQINAATNIPIPNIADAIVSNIENMANIAVSGFSDISNNILMAFKPQMTKVEKEFEESNFAKRKTSGGRGGGCACASCACACAGGGR